MANGNVSDGPVVPASEFFVEVSPHSHLVFSKLKKFNEVVFWERPEIPDVPHTDGDIFAVLEVQDRIDNLANKIYRDSDYWWLLAIANNIRLQPLKMNPGTVFRVPSIITAQKIVRESR